MPTRAGALALALALDPGPDLSLPRPQLVPRLGHQMASRFHGHQDCGVWEGGFRIPPPTWTGPQPAWRGAWGCDLSPG